MRNDNDPYVDPAMMEALTRSLSYQEFNYASLKDYDRYCVLSGDMPKHEREFHLSNFVMHHGTDGLAKHVVFNVPSLITIAVVVMALLWLLK